MIEETVINIYPIVKFIVILFAIVGGYNVFNNLINNVSRAFKDKLDCTKDIHNKNKDTEILNKIIEYKNKYPDVDLQYILKSDSEKAIDNNQEIHEIIQRLEKMDYYIKQLNIYQSMSLAEQNTLSRQEPLT